MKSPKGNLRICKKGHQYIKSSECPVCPTCDKIKNEEKKFFIDIAAPARRALESKGIITLKQLSKKTEEEILALHGMGPGSLPKLRRALKSQALKFK